MKLDPTLSPSRAHQVLLRRAGQTFGPARTFELNDALAYAGEALSRIAKAPLTLTGFPPDQSGLDSRETSETAPAATANYGEPVGDEAASA